MEQFLSIVACAGGESVGLRATGCGNEQSLWSSLALYKYVIVVIAGWLIVQLIKCVIYCVKQKQFDFREVFFSSGGMPSSHTSTMVAITTLIGLSDGVDNAVFGLALAISLIVIYDSVKSRKSVGDQAELIGVLLKEQQSKIQPPKIVRGHKISEVVVGALLGFLVAVGVFLLTK
ncbi:MAG: divergent PAP2 family protein [Candidatus Nomurabacteria bacterium]|nr:divergent PAP2 family protein [Candidatus Nomurabacteria bacterium]